MKKIVAVLGVALVLASVFSAGATVNEQYSPDDLYAKSTIVIEVDYNNDTVYCEDFNGEVWAFFGCEDWLEGDIASLLMYNNKTSIIYDDEIIKATYSGWIENPNCFL